MQGSTRDQRDVSKLVVLMITAFIDMVGLLMLIPLLSPQGWDYVLLIATPAVVLLANYLDRLPKVLQASVAVAGLTMGFSVFDLMGRPAYGRFMETAAITICASVLLTALYIVRLRRIA